MIKGNPGVDTLPPPNVNNIAIYNIALTLPAAAFQGGTNNLYESLYESPAGNVNQDTRDGVIVVILDRASTWPANC